MEMHQRIKHVVKWLVGNGFAGNQKEVGFMLGYKSESSFSQILNDKVPVPGDFADRLSAISPLLNRDWIISGDGEMIRNDYTNRFDESDKISVNESPSTYDIMKASNSQPILDIRVCAGSGIGLDGSENKVTEWVSIPKFEGCLGVTVFGDSMYDKFKSGDVVFVRPISGRNDIDFGQCYVVITREDRYIKNLYESERGDDYVSMVSYNIETNPDGRRKYPDRNIKKEEILFLYKVAGKLRRSQL